MDENESEVIVETQEETETEVEETTTEEVSQEKPKETPQQKKARLERQLKKVRKELGETDEPETLSKKSGFDYGEKAFLKASGITGADEVELVKKWADRTGDDLDVVIEDEIFQARLEKLRANRETKAAIPSSGRRGTQAPTDSVDYWLTKPFADVPADMKRKVLNARLGKESDRKL